MELILISQQEMNVSRDRLHAQVHIPTYLKKNHPLENYKVSRVAQSYHIIILKWIYCMMLGWSLTEPGLWSHYNYESLSQSPVFIKCLIILLLV